MQKLFGLSLLLSLFTVGVGGFSVKELSNISDDVDELYSFHMRVLELARAINITVLRIVRSEKNLIISTTDEENNKQRKSLAEEYIILDNYLKEIQNYFISAEGQMFLAKMFGVIK